MAKGKIELKVSDDDPGVAYVTLADHPGESNTKIVYKQLALHEIVKEYKGPSVYLNFDAQGHLIGIEILA